MVDFRITLQKKRGTGGTKGNRKCSPFFEVKYLISLRKPKRGTGGTTFSENTQNNKKIYHLLYKTQKKQLEFPFLVPLFIYNIIYINNLVLKKRGTFFKKGEHLVPLSCFSLIKSINYNDLPKSSPFFIAPKQCNIDIYQT